MPAVDAADETNLKHEKYFMNCIKLLPVEYLSLDTSKYSIFALLMLKV
jgi:hypothetical protein